MNKENAAEETAVSPDEKLDFKRILPIFVIVLVDLLGLTIIIPLLPLYAASFQASAFTIGALGATYPVMQLIGAPILGRLSDRYGRKPVLIVSQMDTLAGFILLSVSGALPLVFLSRLIDGISGGNIATIQAAISDSTNEKTRAQGLGLIGAAFGLGFIVGPVIAFAALSLTDQNYRAPAFIAAFFSLLSILLTIFWFKETLPEEQRGNGKENPAFSVQAMITAVTHPAVGALLLLMFAQQLAFGGFEQLLALFTLLRLGLNASGNAIVFVFIGVIVVAVQGGFIGPWSRKFGERRLILAGLALLAVGLSMAALTPHRPVPWYSQEDLTAELNGDEQEDLSTLDLPDDSQTGWTGIVWLLATLIPISVGGGILRPSINSLITLRSDPSEVGGLLGFSSAFSSAANALAPLIGGAIFQFFGSTTPFLAAGALMGILLFFAARAIKD